MKYLLIAIMIIVGCKMIPIESEVKTIEGVNLQIEVNREHVGRDAILIVLAEVEDQQYIYSNEAWLPFEENDSYIGINVTLESDEAIYIHRDNLPYASEVVLHYGYYLDDWPFIGDRLILKF